MVTLYTSPSCTSCRKARAWLEEHNIAYTERNIFSEPTFQELKIYLYEVPINQLFSLIQNNPGLLRRPNMLDEKRFQVGYNEDEIRRFLPREVRAYELDMAQRLVNF